MSYIGCDPDHPTDGDIIRSVTDFVNHDGKIICTYEVEKHQGYVNGPCNLYHVGDTLRLKAVDIVWLQEDSAHSQIKK